MKRDARPLPSCEELNRFLRYEPEVGKLYWNPRAEEFFPDARAFRIWNTRYSGVQAFTAQMIGYYCGTLLGVRYLAHRVIWKMVNGVDPDQIDHINGNTQDNRIDNLRSVTNRLNSLNRSLQHNNKTGYHGVIKTQEDKWLARIESNGVSRYIGTFRNLGEAIAARKAAEKEHGFHQNHGRTNWMFDDL